MIDKLIKINDDQIYAEFYSDEFITIHMFLPKLKEYNFKKVIMEVK
ncbi:hypothetical protein [Anaeromassilibacillus sp. An172]|nr:hypothetical protein [Anaeromassilibacillus sp. An172]